MYKGKKILALIPARGGSKGLPGKNIKILAGKPLIAWSIEEAKKSKYIDKVIVSTDSKSIADIAKQYGAEVPFKRPEELATDNAKSIDVVLHVIEWLHGTADEYDILILLQPTSPLRIVDDIDSAIELLLLKKAESIISVCKCSRSPLWANTLPEDGCMKDFINAKYQNMNRQDIPDFYSPNGALYVIYCDYVKEHKTFTGRRTFAYIMPKERAVDIDDAMDFMFAEFIIQHKRS